MEIKKKKCQAVECDNEFKQFNSLQKYCSYNCEKKNKKAGKPNKTYQIPQMSKKRKVESLQYASDRLIFLSKPENKICPITKKPTTEIHHKKTRIGKMLLDQKYWLAVSREGHLYIHENPKWSYEKGYLISKFEK